MDSLGFYEHVFWSDFRAEQGHTYRIDVVRSDGVRGCAETRVPERVEVVHLVADRKLQRIRIEGDPRVRILKPEIRFTVRFADPWVTPETYFAQPEPPVETYAIGYDGLQEQVAGGWEFDVDLCAAHVDLKAWYAEVYPNFPTIYHDIALVAMDPHVLVGDEVWNPPGGVFDPDLIGNPGVMRNVENGFGFVGAGYRIRGEGLFPMQQAVESSGFYYVPWLAQVPLPRMSEAAEESLGIPCHPCPSDLPDVPYGAN